MSKLQELQNRIGYTFEKEGLLRQALTHSSYANEKHMKKHSDNERLEFLGDAGVEIVSSDFLYRNYPDLPEGDLSFEWLPVATDALDAGGWAFLARSGITVFAAGLLLSLPVIAVLLVANIALGVLTRAAPQLNLFAVGFPITLTAGFIGVLLIMSNFAPVLQSLFERSFDTIGLLLDALAPRPAP